jgi:hypothetical protein
VEYKVYFWAKYNKKEFNISLYRDFDSINISINNEQVLQKKVIDIQPLFDQYNSGNIDGLHYEDRELTKLILTKNYPDIIHSLFKSFAVVNVYLNYSERVLNINYEPHFIENVKKSFNDYCFHSSLVGWTGDLGTQPVMYFLKKDYQNNKDVKTLYELGLLNKIFIEIDREQLQNYFVPFDIPNIPNIMIGSPRITWNKIIKDMNNELSKFNKRW